MSRHLLVALVSLASVASAACGRGRAPEPVVVPAPAPAPATSSRAAGNGVAATPAPLDTVVRGSADSSTVHEYRGSYSSGFEMSWFEPCDAPRGDALWWATLTEDARHQRDSLIKLLPHRPTEGLAVRVLATVSPRMRGGAGHMGRGSRYMLVTRFISLRALGGGEPGGCGPVGRVG
jgi:hypothetical protein